MTPEHVAEVVVYDLRVEGGGLASTVERVVTEDAAQPIGVSWDVEPQDPNIPIGGGVAFVRGDKFKPSFPAPGTPVASGPLSFSLRDPVWSFGLMIVAILPLGFTLGSAAPRPIAAKPFRDRIALFWRPAPDSQGQGSVFATLDELRGDVRRARLPD